MSRVVAAAVALMLMSSGWSAPSTRPQEGRGKAIDLIAEGQTLEQSGDKEAAFQRYLQSVQTAASPAGYYNLGRLARIAGDRDAATRYLNQALQLNPSYEIAKLELVQVQKGSRGKSESAQTVGFGPAAESQGPMNVDKLRREYVTMQSLRRPVQLAADTAVVAPGSLRGQKDPEPSAPTLNAPAPGYARKAAEPAQPAYIEHDSNPKIIVQADRPGADVLDPIQVVPARGKTLTSEHETNTGEVLDPLAPTHVEETELTVTEKRTGKTQLEKNASREDINDAAFGPESHKQRPSTGYGQTSKVALGTFAFHRDKADTYRLAGRYREAAIEYETALRLNSSDTETRTLYAEMLSRHGSTTEAAEQFQKSAAQDPTDARTYYKQGNAYYDQQKFDLAIGAYLRAVELDPRNKFAQNNLGVVYMEQGEYARAVSRFKKVLEIDPNYDMAVLNLGIINDEHLANKDEALKYYEQYLVLKGPRSSEVERWVAALKKQ
ncbi:MAG: tetratricopeptide repeat protein [Candidatus Sumerlaeaceae bacterium]